MVSGFSCICFLFVNKLLTRVQCDKSIKFYVCLLSYASHASNFHAQIEGNEGLEHKVDRRNARSTLA